MKLTVEEIIEAINTREAQTILALETIGLIKEKIQELPLDDEGKNLIETLIDDYECLSLELADQLVQHEDTSDLNPLSHINNQDSMLKVIRREWEGSKRYHNPTSLIVFGLDVLDDDSEQMTDSQKQNFYVELSEIIEKSTRVTDTFGCIDDEKFVIVVPTTNNLQAAWLSTKLIDSITSHEFDMEYKVSCSFGVADSSDSMDEKDWLIIAQEAYNKAVEQGGNTVIDYETIIEK